MTGPSPVDDRALARSLALARMGIGAAFLASPRGLVSTWTGERADDGAALAGRSLGGRDLALGAGLLAALTRGDARAWLAAGAAADAFDALGSLSALRSTGRARHLLFLSTASAAAVIGSRLARRLSPGRSPPLLPGG